MKLFGICLLSASANALGQNDLARQIAHKVHVRGFADYVARRVGEIGTLTQNRLDELATISERIYTDICKPTADFLHANNSPDNILEQIDGIPLTIDNYKRTSCAQKFADVPLPCFQLVDATEGWCVADLCSRYSAGLEVNRATKFGVCLEWLPAASSA